MKAWGGIWLAFGLFTILGCRAMREIDPAQSPWLNDWLLIHVNGEDESRIPMQQNFLVGLTALDEGGHSVMVFTTEVREGGSDFKFGVTQAAVDLPGRRKSLTFSSHADSAGQGVRFYLNSKSLWMNLPIQKGSLGRPVNLRLELGNRKWNEMGGPGIKGCRFWQGTGEGRGGTFPKTSKLQVSMLGIPNLEAMLALGQGGSVVWLNAPHSQNPHAGFYRFQNGQLHGLGGFLPELAHGNSEILVDSVWRSNHSGVGYPIGIQLDDYGVVSTSNANQELPLGKRSFWMGMIRFAADSTALESAQGNMVIFHPIPN